jgi:hypothetical protein
LGSLYSSRHTAQVSRSSKDRVDDGDPGHIPLAELGELGIVYLDMAGLVVHAALEQLTAGKSLAAMDTRK